MRLTTPTLPASEKTPAPVILQGDARNLPLPKASVDLVVTSPPYYGLRSYQDGGRPYAGQIGAESTPAEYLDALIEATRECVRVLKPTGSLFVNLGDRYSTGNSGHSALAQLSARYRGGGHSDAKAKRKSQRTPAMPTKTLLGLPWRYAIRCVDELGLILRAEIVWSKPNSLPESVTDRVRRSHETWFHFTVSPRYYSAVDEIRQPHAPASLARPQRARHALDRFSVGTPQTLNPAHCVHPAGRLPGSVWDIPTQPLKVPTELGLDHFAAFPMEWPRRLILGWSPPQGVVLDPFGGTGTTALVAYAHGRLGITMDASSDYCRLARWRVADPRQQARAATPPAAKPYAHRPRPADGNCKSPPEGIAA
jgi:DNA modification methylase